MADSGDARAQGGVLLLVRAVLGALMIYYGVQHVFGLMGGDGFDASAQRFADTFSVPFYVGQTAVIGQLVAGVLILLGFLTRFAAALVGALMAVAAVIGAKTTESLVKTTSSDPLAAVGYPTALMVMAIALIALGGGLLSLDSNFKTKRRKAKVAQIS